MMKNHKKVCKDLRMSNILCNFAAEIWKDSKTKEYKLWQDLL